MSQKDGWFVGLLAMIYLYLDSSFAPRPVTEEARHVTPAERNSVGSSRFLPVRAIPRGVCPRNHLHPVTLRGDGAMWCRGCDEAFYPQAAIWGSLATRVAA